MSNPPSYTCADLDYDCDECRRSRWNMWAECDKRQVKAFSGLPIDDIDPVAKKIIKERAA